VVPDIICLAKGMGNGLPVAAIAAGEAVMSAWSPGDHGTTFGGNPLACAAGNAVLDVMLAPGFLDDVARKGRVLWAAMEKLVAEFPTVFEDVRGSGLIQGLKCHVPCAEVQAAFTAEGLLTVTAGENVVRLVPPLVLTDADLAEGVRMMRRGAARCVPAVVAVAAK
jgi:acetylornithine/N-succinyldiaminopimelate aminotransferase